MLIVFSITFPIYAAIAIGYVVVQRGWFAPSDMRVLGQYVLNIALPALLFHAVASRDLSEVFHLGYMLTYLLGGLATIVISFLWFTFTGAQSQPRAVAVMGSVCPNSGFVGYPVVFLAFPDQAGVILALNFLIENILLVPICLVLVDLSKDRGDVSILRRLGGVFWGILKRPMVIALLSGLVFSLAQIPIPAAVNQLLNMLAASASALALVVIGGTLVGLPLKGNRAFAAQIAAGKLVVHPALVAITAGGLVALGLVALPPELHVAVILSAAMPMFGVYTVFAQEQGQEGIASIAMLMATSLAFVTLSALLLWLT